MASALSRIDLTARTLVASASFRHADSSGTKIPSISLSVCWVLCSSLLPLWALFSYQPRHRNFGNFLIPIRRVFRHKLEILRRPVFVLFEEQSIRLAE